MPRPKRTRGVATRQPKQADEPSAPTETQPSARDTNIRTGSSLDIYDLSDREKEKTRARAASLNAEADGAERQGAPTRPEVRTNPQNMSALRNSIRRRDQSMARLDDLTSTSKTIATSSDDVESPPEVGRRGPASPRHGRPTDISGLDLDDDTFGDLDDSLDGRDDTQTAHQSTDTSSLNVAAFRKRRRQSSIVGRDDAPIRPSSRGPNTPGISSTINFSNFRRRPREPSILGRGRSNSRQPQASGDEADDDLNFTRDIGVTPLRNSSRQPGAPSSAVSRQPSENGRSRKRKSLEDHGSDNKRPALDSEDEIHDSIEVDEHPDASPRGRSPPRPATSDPDDPDLAPPLSSGSSEAGDAAIWPPLDSLAHRTYRSRRPASRAQKTPELGADDSDISSPPSLTHSPDYQPVTRAKRNAQPSKAKVTTTADLASMLPRRRHKKTTSTNNPFDITGSDAEEDGSIHDHEDDELSYSVPRTTRGNRASRPASRGAASKTRKPARRTYGSRSSDKENQEEIVVGGEPEDEDEDAGETALPDEETSQMMLARLGEELKNAAKKFKEVDKWELEFEEVTQSSSPRDAR